MLLVSIQDTVSKLFLAPFIEQNEETAKRTFKVLCREPGMISKAPADYQILQVGEFDQLTGVVVGSTHKLIMTGKEATEE